MDFKEIYESFERENRIEKIATEEDVKNYQAVKSVGEKFSVFPPPETREKALEWLEKYYGARQADVHVRQFKSKFPIEVRPLQDQLKKIKQFIEEADNMNSVDAVDGTNLNNSNKDHYEYLKWKCGHYKVAPFYSSHSFLSSDLIRVYGKYVLYKKWLEQQLRDLSVKNPVVEHKEKLKFLETINPKKEITIFERIKRELNTIHLIYISQLMTVENDVDNIINEDGRICWIINIRSDRQLHSIEDYKQHYTDRFENAKTQVVVKNELIEIYRTAQTIISLYEQSILPPLTDLYNAYNSNPVLRIQTEAYRTMIILVVDYQPQNILFGYESNSNDHRTVFTIRDFNYVVRNDEVVEFCLKLINFINTFEIPALMYKGMEEMVIMKDKLEVDIVNRVEQPEMFKEMPSVENRETKHTYPEHNPNLWNLKCYDLFKYLFENYYTNTKRQLTNIWFFLAQNRNDTYKFYATKDAYKAFILEWYAIEIKNVDKAERKWEEKDLPSLKEHLRNFENT